MINFDSISSIVSGFSSLIGDVSFVSLGTAGFAGFFLLDRSRFGFAAALTGAGAGGGVSFFGSSGGGAVIPKRFNRIFSSHSSMPCR